VRRVETTTIEKADGTVVCARCTVADTAGARMKGLLGRSSLDPGEGILLKPAGSVHMFFMRFAIDAIFCDRELNVIGVARDLRPWRMAGRRGAKIVIEVAAGAAADVRSGDRLVLGTIDP
jgi:uncharacterized membrane protein (UPF0127 family)